MALFARLRLIATEEFAELLERRDLMPSRVSVLIRTQWQDILVGAFVPLASFALFHLVTIFSLSYVELFTNEAPASFLLLELAGCVAMTVGVMISGLLSDYIGRRVLLGSCAAGIAGFSFAVPFPPDRRSLGQRRLHHGGVFAARPVVRAGCGRGRLELREPESLHRLGAHLRHRLAPRRRLRAARGAVRLRHLRAMGGVHLPALGSRLHARRARGQ